MNQDQIDSVVRSLVKVAGGILTAHGLTATAAIVNSQNVIELLVGIVMAVAGFYASHTSNSVPPVGTVTVKTQDAKVETSTTTPAAPVTAPAPTVKTP